MARNKQIAGEKEKVEATPIGPVLDLQAEVAKQTEAIQAAIKAGDIVPEISIVKKAVEKTTYAKQYLKLVPTNLKGCIALSNGVETTWAKDKDAETFDFQGPCLVKDFHYGNDLGTKNRESQRIAVMVEGPDKAKMVAAKNIAKAFNITEEEALAKIEAMGL